jgi:hypothetical protein
MKIDSTGFGSITINGTTYTHGILVLGAGQYGNVTLSPEAAKFFEHHDCRVILQPTPDAIETCNKTRNKTIGLFHVTAEPLPPVTQHQAAPACEVARMQIIDHNAVCL